MPTTRRPTHHPASLSTAEAATPATAAESATHELGLLNISAYAGSATSSHADRALSVAPAAPAVSRRSRAASPSAPPAYPTDTPVVAALTLKSLDAWAAAPGQSREEQRERATVVKYLTQKSFLRPRKLEKAPSLDLSNMTNLTCLPEGLSVPGYLYMNGCSALTHLPKKLSVGGNFYLTDCSALTQLPEGLRVGGTLQMSRCTALTRVAKNISVTGDLYMRGCTALTQLTERLLVGGNLSLRGCTALAQITGSLSVFGDLNLDDCSALIQLPEEVRVSGSLSLRNCSFLTRLPEQLSVGGHLTLTGCISLTQLPDHVLQWPPQNNGSPHIIDISDTGIREADRRALGRRTGEGVRLVHDVHEERAADPAPFSNLSEAMAFWRPLAYPSGSGVDSDGDTAHTLHADPQQLTSFLEFLGRLRGTADYQNQNSRPLLAQRIVGLADQLAASESLAALCHERVGQALESCGDRVIWAMNQLELTVRVHQAQQGSAPEQRLRDLGRSLLRLQIVHQHAAAKVASLRLVDPIEVYLAYETKLAQPLGLPLSSQGMLYAFCSNVTHVDLENASQAAKQADADPRQVEAYLATWEPWQGLMRRQQAEACTWQRLPLAPQGARLDPDQVCILTRETAADLQASGSRVAAVRNAGGQWEPYEFASLLRWWTQEGLHPVHRTPMRLEDIYRLGDELKKLETKPPEKIRDFA
jgi:hypothetical protein